MDHHHTTPRATLMVAADDRIITLLEAAHRTTCSVATLRREAQRGHLRLTRLSARRVGIRLSDLDRWLAARAA